MLTRLDCEIVDMGVVPDVPDALERAFATAAANADVVITSGGVSVGEADFVKQLLDKLGEVLFWKIAMKPGRPLAYGKHRRRAFLRPARQSGRGDGDVLPIRARCAAGPAGTTRRRADADVQGHAVRADQQGAGPHRIPARHPVRRAAMAAGPCARPATRARASCRRCRRRTASSCCRRRPATSRPARPSTCNCSKACSDATGPPNIRRSGLSRRRPAASMARAIQALLRCRTCATGGELMNTVPAITPIALQQQTGRVSTAVRSSTCAVPRRSPPIRWSSRAPSGAMPAACPTGLRTSSPGAP